MLSIAEQTPAELGGSLSVLHRQRRDHVRLAHLLQELGRTPGREQGPVLLDIYRLVFPHAFAEEAVLWPVMRRLLPDGYELTLRVEREHQVINALVLRLQSLPSDAADRQDVLVRTMELLVEDVRDEEDLLLPRLQSVLTPAQLKLLGLAWEVVRRVAPTRPHPIVSRRPPGNVLSALPLSLLDRTRDRLDAASYRSASASLAARLRRTSAALMALSNAVERLPGMRAGEDPQTRHPSRFRRGPGAALMMAFAVTGGALFSWQRRRATAGRASELVAA
jgi:hemerythrin superfamily protein